MIATCLTLGSVIFVWLSRLSRRLAGRSAGIVAGKVGLVPPVSSHLTIGAPKAGCPTLRASKAGRITRNPESARNCAPQAISCVDK
jgi:hypothetical protein